MNTSASQVGEVVNIKSWLARTTGASFWLMMMVLLTVLLSEQRQALAGEASRDFTPIPMDRVGDELNNFRKNYSISLAGKCTPFFTNPSDIFKRRTLWVDPQLISVDDTGGLCAPWVGSPGNACGSSGGMPFSSIPRGAPSGTTWPYFPYFVIGYNCGGVGGKTVYQFEFGLGPAGADVYPLIATRICNANGQMMSLHNRNTQKVAEVTVQVTASPNTTGYPTTETFDVNPGGNQDVGCTIFNNVSLGYEITNAIYK